MKKAGKILKWVVLGTIILVVIIICCISVIRFINSRRTKITAKNGIQESTMVEIGGIKQYIQIRGQNKDNPVVVFLHGGPGSPMSYIDYTYQIPLEEDYTFVNWDQRGCGRTYYANPDMKAPLSKKLLLSDLDNLVDYLRNRFKQDKVIIIGHSWGTVLGSQYVHEHPEKVMAYLGVGQTVNGFKGYYMAANEALRLAKEQNNTKDVKQLTEIISGLSGNTMNVNQITEIQKYTRKYMTYKGVKSAFGQMWMGIASPDMSLDDLKWYLKISDIERYDALECSLLDECMAFDLNSLGQQYKVPMYYISGEADWTTPRVMVEEYYKNLEAPDKDMVVIKNAGHSPFIDQPKLFQEAVKSLLSRIK